MTCLATSRSIYAKKKQKYILVKEFQEHVTEYKTLSTSSTRSSNPMPKCGTLCDADFEATNTPRRSTNTCLGSTAWTSGLGAPALVYFKHFRQQPKLLAEFFQSLERLTYFLLVTKVGINERIETYAALTKEVEPETFKGIWLRSPR